MSVLHLSQFFSVPIVFINLDLIICTYEFVIYRHLPNRTNVYPGELVLASSRRGFRQQLQKPFRYDFAHQVIPLICKMQSIIPNLLSALLIHVMIRNRRFEVK